MIRVRSEAVETTIRRLQTYVARMEARYECPTLFILDAVRYRERKETAEIARWLAAYQELESLRVAYDQLMADKGDD